MQGRFRRWPSSAVSAVALLWLFVAINLRRSRRYRAGATTVLKLLPMLAIILLGLWMLVTHRNCRRTCQPRRSAARRDGSFDHWTVRDAGHRVGQFPVRECRPPGRTIPRATIVGTLLTAAIYLIVTAVMLLPDPEQELANAQAPFVDC